MMTRRNPIRRMAMKANGGVVVLTPESSTNVRRARRHSQSQVTWSGIFECIQEKDRSYAMFAKGHSVWLALYTLTGVRTGGNRPNIHVPSVERIHSGEKPLKCRHCDDVFRTSSDRKQHEITWHGAPGSHVCRKSPCSHCDSARRRRSRLEKQGEATRAWSFMVDSGGGIETLRTLLPVKQLAAAPSDAVNVVQPDQFIETAAQFTSLPSIQIKPSAGSAFDQCAKQVDTTVSLTASLLLDSASRNSSILVTLSDSQILSISCAGLVKALQNCDSGE
ncbi:unnamed protein product [Nippostrongylus brasiliensis]|uniref:C2H2-type domain-containing protein n=1 Tax=Nippostrongylus brasiliensis TaxID=27835 RepID=A0A0N4XHT0_NIPBR|nr:unnamed protein product [Nippostrongylus brasiliensis]